jgi:carbamoylphosphate synthase large subunit
MNNYNFIEINKVEGIQNSSSKLRMKNCFTKGNVKTARWFTARSINSFVEKQHDKIDVGIIAQELPYPIVAKSHFGSRNKGNSLINNFEELQKWATNKTMSNYIFERYYQYNREYRVHVTEDGAFYSCRKMLKSGTPEDQKWHRHDDNCVWIREDSESNLFEKPSNWNQIVEHCVLALKSVGLDFGACDVRVQNEKKDKTPDFIIIEINSAPSFGENDIEKKQFTYVTERYIETLTKLIAKKTR